MTTPGDESLPNKVQPSHPDPAAEGRHQEEKHGESHPEEDPAEGSRETIDRELKGRKRLDGEGAQGAARAGRRRCVTASATFNLTNFAKTGGEDRQADAAGFDSFFMAGFECSSHRRKDGARLDLIRATSHNFHALGDYRRCAQLGLRTIRDGLRWHLIETAPGVYDWSSWSTMVEAAHSVGVQVIWDILHYGSPDHIDQGSAGLIEAYASFAAEAVRLHRSLTGQAPLVCPINEISFFAWAVEVGYFPPAGPKKRGWFKRHLVKAAVAGIRAMRQAEPDCRFIWAEPLIHIAPRDRSRPEQRRAESARLGQFEVYDMLMGRVDPELGGSEDLVDVVGLNFYPHNQWYLRGPTIPMGHHEYRALSQMLLEVSHRYGKPMFIAETGSEGSGGPAWLHYVCDEVRAAMELGAPIEGICLYPITAYPGWDNSRHAEVGLFSAIHADGSRRIRQSVADELARQRELFTVARGK